MEAAENMHFRDPFPVWKMHTVYGQFCVPFHHHFSKSAAGRHANHTFQNLYSTLMLLMLMMLYTVAAIAEYSGNEQARNDG